MIRFYYFIGGDRGFFENVENGKIMMVDGISGFYCYEHLPYRGDRLFNWRIRYEIGLYYDFWGPEFIIGLYIYSPFSCYLVDRVVGDRDCLIIEDAREIFDNFQNHLYSISNTYILNVSLLKYGYYSDFILPGDEYMWYYDETIHTDGVMQKRKNIVELFKFLEVVNTGLWMSECSRRTRKN